MIPIDNVSASNRFDSSSFFEGFTLIIVEDPKTHRLIKLELLGLWTYQSQFEVSAITGCMGMLLTELIIGILMTLGKEKQSD